MDFFSNMEDNEEKIEKSEEEKKSKYDVEVAMHEELYMSLSTGDKLSMIEYYTLAYRFYKQTHLMLFPKMDKKEKEKFKTIKEEIIKELAELNKLQAKYKIIFVLDEQGDLGEWKTPKNSPIIFLPPDFAKIIQLLTDNFDGWQITLREIMVRLGIIFRMKEKKKRFG